MSQKLVPLKKLRLSNLTRPKLCSFTDFQNHGISNLYYKNSQSLWCKNFLWKHTIYDPTAWMPLHVTQKSLMRQATGILRYCNLFLNKYVISNTETGATRYKKTQSRGFVFQHIKKIINFFFCFDNAMSVFEGLRSQFFLNMSVSTQPGLR